MVSLNYECLTYVSDKYQNICLIVKIDITHSGW